MEYLTLTPQKIIFYRKSVTNLNLSFRQNLERLDLIEWYGTAVYKSISFSRLSMSWCYVKLKIYVSDLYSSGFIQNTSVYIDWPIFTQIEFVAKN